MRQGVAFFPPGLLSSRRFLPHKNFFFFEARMGRYSTTLPRAFPLSPAETIVFFEAPFAFEVFLLPFFGVGPGFPRFADRVPLGWICRAIPSCPGPAPPLQNPEAFGLRPFVASRLTRDRLLPLVPAPSPKRAPSHCLFLAFGKQNVSSTPPSTCGGTPVSSFLPKCTSSLKVSLLSLDRLKYLV